MENLEYEMQFIGHCSEWQEELLCFLFVKLYVGVKCLAILLYTKRAQMYANFKKIGIAICFVNGGRESRLSCAHQTCQLRTWHVIGHCLVSATNISDIKAFLLPC